MIGNKNAAVFPDPVGAQANICLPCCQQKKTIKQNLLKILNSLL